VPPSEPTHPTSEQLGEFAADLLPAAAQARVEEHLAGCAACRRLVATIPEISRLLAAAPLVPMPPELAAGLTSGIAANAQPAGVGASVLPMRRRRRPPGIAALSAAAAALILVAGIVVGLRSTGTHTPSAAAPRGAGGAQNTSYPEAATTVDYTRATLPAAIPQLAAGAVPDRVPVPSASASANGAYADATSVGHGAPLLGALETSPPALFACVGYLTSAHTPPTPQSVTFARYEGRPAAIILLPTAGQPNELDVWVVGSTCTATRQDVLLFLRVPRPG
jgi:anti-sigma factor RsiW